MATTGSCIGACGMSRLFFKRLDMEIIVHATFAGGVAIGSSSSMVLSAGVSCVVGLIAGIVAATGVSKLSPYLRQKLNLHDTCGVLSAHGLPGVIGGIVGSISTTLAEGVYGEDSEKLAMVFPAVADIVDGRTASEQAWM